MEQDPNWIYCEGGPCPVCEAHGALPSNTSTSAYGLAYAAGLVGGQRTLGQRFWGLLRALRGLSRRI